MTTLQKRLDNVSLSFRDNNLTVGPYIPHLTCSSECTETCQEAQKLWTDHAVSICNDLANYLPTWPSIISWTIKTAKQIFRKDLSELTQEQHGLHFHANKASSSYLEGSFMKEICTSSVGPCILLYFIPILLKGEQGLRMMSLITHHQLRWIWESLVEMIWIKWKWTVSHKLNTCIPWGCVQVAHRHWLAKFQRAKQHQILHHYIFCQASGYSQYKIRFKMWLWLSVAMHSLWLKFRFPLQWQEIQWHYILWHIQVILTRILKTWFKHRLLCRWKCRRHHSWGFDEPIPHSQCTWRHDLTSAATGNTQLSCCVALNKEIDF